MSKPTRGGRRSEIVVPAVRQSSALAPADSFDEVLALIDAAKRRAYQAVNLFRMRQFFEAYREDEKVSPLVRELPWTHHLVILSQTKLAEEREFYILSASKGRWNTSRRGRTTRGDTK